MDPLLQSADAVAPLLHIRRERTEQLDHRGRGFPEHLDHRRAALQRNCHRRRPSLDQWRHTGELDGKRQLRQHGTLSAPPAVERRCRNQRLRRRFGEHAAEVSFVAHRDRRQPHQRSGSRRHPRDGDRHQLRSINEWHVHQFRQRPREWRELRQHNELHGYEPAGNRRGRRHGDGGRLDERHQPGRPFCLPAPACTERERGQSGNWPWRGRHVGHRDWRQLQHDRRSDGGELRLGAGCRCHLPECDDLHRDESGRERDRRRAGDRWRADQCRERR